MNQRILNQLEQALASRTKKGSLIFDQDNLEVSVAGTFAGDKFIVIRQKGEPAPPQDA